MNELLNDFKPSKAKKLAKDPALQVYQNLIGFYRDNVYEHISSITKDNDRLRRIYMKSSSTL